MNGTSHSIREEYSRMKRIIFILIILHLTVIATAADIYPDNNPIIRIAIFQMEPEEGNFNANHATIEDAITIATKHGADWFITPELAESGYEFTTTVRPNQLVAFPSSWLQSLGEIAKNDTITLFIGFPQRTGDTYHNAVALIDREGNISGVHQKREIIPGTLEGWATPGNTTTLTVDNLNIGYFICADVVNPDITSRYLNEHVDIMLSSAAWHPDPSMGPDEYWADVTRTIPVPLVIANTAGEKGEIDYTSSVSGVYRDGQKVYQISDPGQVIAFVDWNVTSGRVNPVGEPVPVPQ